MAFISHKNSDKEMILKSEQNTAFVNRQTIGRFLMCEVYNPSTFYVIPYALKGRKQIAGLHESCKNPLITFTCISFF